MENKTIKSQEQIDNEISQAFMKEYEELVRKHKRYFTPLVNLGIAKIVPPPPPQPKKNE